RLERPSRPADARAPLGVLEGEEEALVEHAALADDLGADEEGLAGHVARRLRLPDDLGRARPVVEPAEPAALEVELADRVQHVAGLTRDDDGRAGREARPLAQPL